MSMFVTALEVTLLDDTSNSGRGSWRLDAALLYASDVANRVIAVPVGFITDFASVPRVPLAFWLTGDTCHEAAVVHDYLYKTMLLPRDVADQVLQEASEVTGVPWWRRTLVYWGVRVGGASHFGT